VRKPTVAEPEGLDPQNPYAGPEYAERLARDKRERQARLTEQATAIEAALRDEAEEDAMLEQDGHTQPEGTGS
jgi:hypothetical protein